MPPSIVSSSPDRSTSSTISSASKAKSPLSRPPTNAKEIPAPPYRFAHQEPTIELTSEVAYLLHKANVPHIVWGQMGMALLRVFGIEVKDLQFVVPDKHLQAAYKAILDAGFPPCTNGEFCEIAKSAPATRAVPAEHFHISQKSEEHIVSLHKRSETLGDIPYSAFDLKVPAADDTQVMLANNLQFPRSLLFKGNGNLPNLFPIKILTPARLAESFILLAARYHNQPDCPTVWRQNIRSMVMYLERSEKLFDEHLHRRFKPFWQVYKHGGPGSDVDTQLCQLQKQILDPPCPHSHRGSSKSGNTTELTCLTTVAHYWA